jgi:hypothetical protein
MAQVTHLEQSQPRTGPPDAGNGAAKKRVHLYYSLIAFQLIQDAHDCLQAAVDVKQLYQNLVQATTTDDALLEKLLMDDLKEFENDLCSMFKVAT